MSKFIPTFEKVTVSDYPYGRLRCTLYNSIDFDHKKGYRHVTQTVNPKTNRINNPKKSTYSNLIVRYYEPETNHIKSLHFSFNGDKEINRAVKFIGENFSLFTEKEISYFYTEFVGMSILSVKASVIYCGAKFEDVKPIYDPFIERMKYGMKNPTENVFDIFIDIEKVKSVEVPDYQPFRIKSSEPINILDL